MAGTLTISTLSDGTNSTSATNCISGSAKAWINFNGTGTPAIRASYNVSSISALGTGRYQINFTNAFADANYCTLYLLAETYATNNSDRIGTINATTGYVQVNANDGAGTLFNALNCNVACFR